MIPDSIGSIRYPFHAVEKGEASQSEIDNFY